MAGVPMDLQWQILRKNSSFLHRNRGVKKTFSREPLNMQKLNSLRYNGLVQKKAVGIEPSKDGKGVVFMYKKARNQNKPRNSVEKVILNKNGRKSMKSIESFMKTAKYRKCLTKLALRRTSQILRSQKPVTVRKQGRRARKVKTV